MKTLVTIIVFSILGALTYVYFPKNYTIVDEPTPSMYEVTSTIIDEDNPKCRIDTYAHAVDAHYGVLQRVNCSK